MPLIFSDFEEYINDLYQSADSIEVAANNDQDQNSASKPASLEDLSSHRPPPTAPPATTTTTTTKPTTAARSQEGSDGRDAAERDENTEYVNHAAAATAQRQRNPQEDRRNVQAKPKPQEDRKKGGVRAKPQEDSRNVQVKAKPQNEESQKVATGGMQDCAYAQVDKKSAKKGAWQDSSGTQGTEAGTDTYAQVEKKPQGNKAKGEDKTHPQGKKGEDKTKPQGDKGKARTR